MKKFILIVLVFGVLLGLVSIPVLYPVAKLVRSEQHLNDALEAKEAGDDLKARGRLLAAYNLVKDNPRINSLLGPYTADVYDPNALGWWMDAVDQGLIDFDGIVDMIEYGLRINQADKVRPYLFDISQTHPDDPRTRSLQVLFLQRDRRPEETRILAHALVSEGEANLEVFSTYVQSTLMQPDIPESDRDEALANLKSMSEEEGDIGIYSLRVLLQVWDFLDSGEQELVKERLRAHELCGLADHLTILSLEKRDGADDETIVQAARDIYEDFAEEEEVLPSKSLPMLATFVDWLTREGYPEIALEYLPDADRIKDPNVFFVRQIALILSDNPAAARDASFVDNPLSPARNFVTRAMAQSALGETGKVLPNLELAVDNVNVEEVPWLEQFLQQRGFLDLTVEMYEGLERRLGNPIPAQVRLLAYYRYMKQEQEMQRVVQDINLNQLSGLLINQLSALYDIILYNYEKGDVRRHVESLSVQYPDLIEVRLILAFTYAMAGEAEASLLLIDGWEKFPLQNNQSFAVMLAYIYKQAGEPEKAMELISGIDRDSLLIKERHLLRPLI